MNVGINVDAEYVVYNDTEGHVVDLLSELQNLSSHDADMMIMNVINCYDLSSDNKEGYMRLRHDYNKSPSWDKFYALVCHSFSNQIRFNKKGEFNLPFGKRTYNDVMRNNFKKFVDKLNNKHYSIINYDFREFIPIQGNYFYYAYPPYLISTATYNENGGWTEQDERDLLSYLDMLNKLGFNFALSNVLHHKGRTNELLLNWCKKYNVHYLKKDYKNCNYQSKNNDKPTVEVLITNYL